MNDKYAHLRVPNDRGGMDLTAEGWDLIAALQEKIATATRKCAETLRAGGRHSVDYKAARAAWTMPRSS